MKRLLVLLACLGLLTAAHAQTPVAPVTKTAPPSENIRFDFRDAPMLQVIRLLTEISGANIVATEKASTRKVSVFLQGLSMQAALDAICKSAGLWYRKDEATGVWRVMTLDEYQRDIVVYRAEQTRVFTLRNSNVIASANAISALFGSRVKLSAGVEESPGIGNQSAGTAPGASGGTTGGSARTITQPLSAGQIASTLDQLGSDDSSPNTESEGRLANSIIEPPPIFITYNRLHNLLIARTSDLEALHEIGGMITEIDRPTRQVLLEMKVLEVTIGSGFRSVFDIGATSGDNLTGPPVGRAPNPLAPNAIGSQAILGTGNFPLEGGSLVFQLMNERVLARLQLLATSNKVNVLSTPTVLASNNQQSKLFVGEERTLITGVSSNTVTNQNQSVTTLSPTTEKRNIGNTLLILPRINADGTVTLSISQDISTVLPKSTSIPISSANGILEFPIDTVNTSNLQVTIIAKHGQSIAVGGMIRERLSDAESKVPILGDIPVLGFFFKRKVKENSRTELVLVVTPHIVETPEDAESQSREALGVHSTHPKTPFKTGKHDAAPPAIPNPPMTHPPP